MYLLLFNLIFNLTNQCFIILFKQQILNVDGWILIPNNPVVFPSLLNTHTPLNLNTDSKLHLLIEANCRIFNNQQNINKCSVC